MKSAMIIGVTGQSPSYLAEELIRRGYYVVGTRRRNATANLWRLENCLKNSNFELVYGDIIDAPNIFSLLYKFKPHIIFNASAQSHVQISFEQPLATWKINAEGHLNLLEGVRQICPSSKVIFFGSSEMFGNNFIIKNNIKIQNEDTPFSPVSPYGISKYAAFNATKIYRESYGIKCFSGIMYNKESPRRGINFVTRKITSYFYNLKKNGFTEKLKLGNLNSFRDWSWSPEVMTGLTNLAESELNDDYVFASEETHSIQEFLDEVGKLHNLDWREFVEIDSNLLRPNELHYLCGDASKIKCDLNWENKIKFKELVRLMMEGENGLE